MFWRSVLSIFVYSLAFLLGAESDPRGSKSDRSGSESDPNGSESDPEDINETQPSQPITSCMFFQSLSHMLAISLKSKSERTT